MDNTELDIAETLLGLCLEFLQEKDDGEELELKVGRFLMGPEYAKPEDIELEDRESDGT